MQHPGRVTIVGGGLAGSEAAWQLAVRGIPVTLYEMRPGTASPAHHTDRLAELVCSNSFKSDDAATAAGGLKRELDALGSLVITAARATAVPAGAALAVDRDRFASLVTRLIGDHPRIEIVHEEALDLPEAGEVIVTSGPLTSDALAARLADILGAGHLAFYDAAAPIVDAATIDRSVVFAASRYDKGGGADYLNAPMERDEYEAFIGALLDAARVTAKEFERTDLFQACQPVEEVARSGHDAPRYGALKPVGLVDPRTGRRPWAVAQLRPENAQGTAYNLVGFQTNLTFPEQRRVFRMLPGLADAEFLRYGVMHRNTFVDAPRLLGADLSLRTDPRVLFAGQITGTEGYLEAAGTGLLAALNVAARRDGAPAVVLPRDTLLGALLAYATDPETTAYQPMHVNFGLVPPLDPPVRGKRDRYAAYASRAAAAMRDWVEERPDLGLTTAAASTAEAVAAAAGESRA